MASELERWIQAVAQTQRQAVTQVASLMQSVADSLLNNSFSGAFGMGSFGSGLFGVGTGGTVDFTTIRSNGNTQMKWDATADLGGLWDDYNWDAAPAALSVGGFVWNHAGSTGQWDAGAVWQ